MTDREGDPSRRAHHALAHSMQSLALGLACFLAGGVFGVLLARSMGFADIAGIPGALLGVVAMIALAFTSVRVEADGFRVSRAFGSRTVRWSDVADIRAIHPPRIVRTNFVTRIAVGLKDGSSVEIDHDARFGVGSPQVLLSAMKQAHARYESASASPAAIALDELSQKGARGLRAAMARGEGGPRTAPVTADLLWPIVEDPTAHPKHRAAAAVALSGALSPEDRTRIRIAAESTVLPELRIALEAVEAGATEEALDDELAHVDAATHRSHPR